jgi:predicted Zn-dependent peptidase
MADLDAASLEDVEKFFRTYYAPNNAVLTLCGAFDPAEARALVERYFGEIPAGPPVPPLPGQPELPAILGGEIREVVEQDISLARLYLSYRIPPYGTEEFYAAAVAAQILAWGKASRLYRALIREQRVAQDVVAYAFPIVAGAAMLVLWATASPGVPPATLEAALLREIEALGEVRTAEVERAINLIEARRLIDLQRVDERADQLSMYATLFDDPGRINTELDRFRAVTPEAVRDFAARYLGADNRAVLLYIPEKEATPGGMA